MGNLDNFDPAISDALAPEREIILFDNAGVGRSNLWALWCGPCRRVSPALEQLARDLAGQVKLVKVNVDTSPQISRRFGAQAIPTLLVLRRGQVSQPGRQAPPPRPPCGPGLTMRSPTPLAGHCCALSAPRRCRARPMPGACGPSCLQLG